MTDLQARHAPAVLANKLHVATGRWGMPCLGYLLCLLPDPAAAAAFASIQDSILALEPSLLRQPTAALHSSIAWLLPVGRDFDEPKDETWQRHGADWLKVISCVTDATAPLRLSYRHLVVSDAAIIAVAQEPNLISELRRAVVAALGLPWPIAYSSDNIVHTSLFRYGGPLADPAGLLQRLAGADITVATDVSELLVVRETSYPTLAYEIVSRLPLCGRQTRGSAAFR
jgi:hypothetical protein